MLSTSKNNKDVITEKRKVFACFGTEGTVMMTTTLVFMNTRTFQHADFKKGAEDQIASFITKKVWENFLF